MDYMFITKVTNNLFRVILCLIPALLMAQKEPNVTKQSSPLQFSPKQLSKNTSIILDPNRTDTSWIDASFALCKSHHTNNVKRGPRGQTGKTGRRGQQGCQGIPGWRGPKGPSGIGDAVYAPTAVIDVNFTARQDPSPTASGRWQIFVIRPDSSQVPGPIINIRDPSAAYTFQIPVPFYFGLYTVTIYDIDMENTSILDVLVGGVHVINTFSNVHIKLFDAGVDLTDGHDTIYQEVFRTFLQKPPF